MTLRLRPEITQLIDDQVKRGRFSTPEEVIEAAIVEKYYSDAKKPDVELQAAIDESRAELDRGEGIPFEEVEASWGRGCRVRQMPAR